MLKVEEARQRQAEDAHTKSVLAEWGSGIASRFRATSPAAFATVTDDAGNEQYLLNGTPLAEADRGDLTREIQVLTDPGGIYDDGLPPRAVQYFRGLLGYEGDLTSFRAVLESSGVRLRPVSAASGVGSPGAMPGAGAAGSATAPEGPAAGAAPTPAAPVRRYTTPPTPEISAVTEKANKRLPNLFREVDGVIATAKTQAEFQAAVIEIVDLWEKEIGWNPEMEGASQVLDNLIDYAMNGVKKRLDAATGTPGKIRPGGTYGGRTLYYLPESAAPGSTFGRDTAELPATREALSGFLRRQGILGLTRAQEDILWKMKVDKYGVA